MRQNIVIYKALQDDFFNDVINNYIVDKMVDAAECAGMPVHDSERTSWKNNAPKIKELLELAKVKNTFVTFEYLIPYNNKRVDCMLYGSGTDGIGNVVHIELKQWSNDGVKNTASEGNFEVDAFTGGAVRTVSHPSLQVKGYNNYIESFMPIFDDKQMHLNGMAYCYNYLRFDSSKPTILFSDRYKSLEKPYRTFASDEKEELASELGRMLQSGNGLEIFNKVQSSPQRPTKKLMESVATMLDDGNSDEFSLIEEQIVARNAILDKIRHLSEMQNKNVIIIKGGPGTGKTVIALHILAKLARWQLTKRKTYNMRYATQSKPLIECIKNSLSRNGSASQLICRAVDFIPANFNENELDLLLIDESHRMKRSPNSQYTRKDKITDLSVVDTIVRAAKIAVFFIDDYQVVRRDEIGSTEMIKECAKRWNASVEEIELVSQFRCNGSDNYLDWLEQVLYNKKVSSHFSEDEFDFRVFDTPQSLYEKIVEMNKDSHTARLTAGFCWQWSKELDENGELIKDVQIGDFAMPWETHNAMTRLPKGYCHWYEWAYKPEGIKQVGCIYTAQGFEFDYIGVIIGPDLFFDKNTQTICTDQKMIKDPMLRTGARFDEYSRNIYRVLMSRGMKGCYVYAVDENLRNYLKTQIQ